MASFDSIMDRATPATIPASRAETVSVSGWPAASRAAARAVFSIK